MIEENFKNNRTLNEFFKNRSIAILKNKKMTEKLITKTNSNFIENKNNIEL